MRNTVPRLLWPSLRGWRWSRRCSACRGCAFSKEIRRYRRRKRCSSEELDFRFARDRRQLAGFDEGFVLPAGVSSVAFGVVQRAVGALGAGRGSIPKIDAREAEAHRHLAHLRERMARDGKAEAFERNLCA